MFQHWGGGPPPLWDPPRELIAALRGDPPGSVSRLPPGRRGWTRTRVLLRFGSMVLWREGPEEGNRFSGRTQGGNLFQLPFRTISKSLQSSHPVYPTRASVSVHCACELAVMEQPVGSYQTVGFCRLQYPTLSNFTFPADTGPTIQA